ncbi:membrane-bound serine protease (ClpP class) [Kushneria avicenniae]|uniref:Membrane-bound serine protease (ClpP class) n=1 Tax=Kushneria avicenniae TaxID=402385 RepID=A0A1I1I2X4_9GAMM|nr:NfeD family protein [Kushneria avicenniae]SFC30554.1 membrane-bound serine protease (ClpP class) [Kushneria avicenniae]
MNPAPRIMTLLCLSLVALPAWAATPMAVEDGILIVMLGLVLIAIEAITPTFGVVGLLGLLVFVIGASMMVNAGLLPGGDSMLGMAMVIGAALLLGGFLLWVVMRFLRFRRITPMGGREEVIGAVAEATRHFTEHHQGDYHGYVHVRGERWQARSTTPVAEGEHRRISEVHGLVLILEREAVLPASPAPSTNK